ncbi:serine/threonine protein kinase [Solihabitans fulvus]|uniref:non-specific serine/threonine protein kinase n=2 Tax=Solihabitans fulvus TaxID=1892852 RepID=A0A5B2WKH0_9PSEU|nr:serine/threonine protein kinase [Solihabitans fulvus]
MIAERYRLRHVLGSGSMGRVWAAYDEMLHRPVAVKEVLLAPGMPAGEADALRERTLREARAIAVLSHPNLVVLHDVVRQDGEPFVVMELVPSRSLNEVLREHGPLGVTAVAVVADAIAAALEAAHRGGVTHRDVKPGNVLVGEDGMVKLTDFGISRSVAEVTMTSSGIMLGSPAFMAPEAASGGVVTPAADLWGLGATLFAATEGRPPYDVDNDALATVNEVVHGEVPEPANAGELAPVIAALMVKDPRARMPLVEVRRQIRSLLPEPGTQAFPTAPVSAAKSIKVSLPRKPVIPPDAPLAADPGPLPFLVQQPPAEPPAPAWTPQPPRRGPLVRTLLVLVALLVFAGAGGAGFVLTRTVGGLALLPPAPPPAAKPPPSAAPVTQSPLVKRTVSAHQYNGGPGADFSVLVDPDWSEFVEPRQDDGSMPPSTVVHFVAPDGQHELMVQRFPQYYPGLGINAYVKHVQQSWPKGDYVPLQQDPDTTPSASGAAPEPARTVAYRTVERGVGSSTQHEQGRSHYVRLEPNAGDLWVIEVSMPTEQEQAVQDLFSKIWPSFAPA